jgi:hypothetical protein
VPDETTNAILWRLLEIEAKVDRVVLAVEALATRPLIPPRPVPSLETVIRRPYWPENERQREARIPEPPHD